MSVILFVKTFSQNICGDRWLKSLEEVDVLMKTYLRSSLKTLFITKPSNSARVILFGLISILLARACQINGKGQIY